MSGSLQVKNGRYHVVTYINKKQKWIATGIPVAGNNKRKAEKRMREILTDLEEKKIDLNRGILLADYVNLWLEEKKGEVELNTWESYGMYVSSVIDPYFRSRRIKLQEVLPQDIKSFYSYLQKDDGKTKPRSVETIRKYRVCLNGAFKMAMENNLVAYNPVDRVKLKKPPEQEAFKGEFYTEAEANALIKLLSDTADPLLPVIQLTLFYGLRRSEVLGLRWSAVDFNNNSIRIERTVVQVKTLIDKKRTKNKKSLRSMPLVPATKQMLLDLKQQQEKEAELGGNSYVHSDYICRLADGTLMKPNYVTMKFGRLMKSSSDKLRKIRFHDLRHTAASLLLAKGYNLQDIQAWLGHESIKSTEIYAHLQAVDKTHTAEIMGAMLDLR